MKEGEQGNKVIRERRKNIGKQDGRKKKGKNGERKEQGKDKMKEQRKKKNIRKKGQKEASKNIKVSICRTQVQIKTAK